MSTNILCQPSSADTNQYLVIAIRILAAVGLSYLLRLLYQVRARPLFPRRSIPERSDAAAEANIGIEPADTAPASQVSLELDFGTYDSGDLGIRIPEPAYHPRGRV